MRILGTPTKELFIDMLTRDISLIAAIVDLVDNSTDGARRLREDGDFNGLSVRIDVSRTAFRIVDNCGGIPYEVARDYAFRFGRADGMEITKHSVGQFGVGMKRAIFKMGNHFFVESKTADHLFTIKQDIREWAKKPLDWDFRFNTLTEGGVVAGERGTTIQVTKLKTDVADVFDNASWVTRLSIELRTRLQEFISQGLGVSVNAVPITADPLVFLSGSELEPARKQVTINGVEPPVSVGLWAGLGKSEDADLAGWHVFCNGRLVLEGDQTEVTGWGVTAGKRIPQFHPQYNHFRGYVFFDCDDAGRLPWTTTKTGLDTDSPVYQAALTEMNILARPVIDFLNQLKTEKEARRVDGKEDHGALEGIVKSSSSAPLKDVKGRSEFAAPKIVVVPTQPTETTVSYLVDRERIKIAKKRLKVRSNKDVGLGTFEYFWNSEVEPFQE